MPQQINIQYLKNFYKSTDLYKLSKLQIVKREIGKNFNRYFSKEDIQMAIKYMKIHSTFDMRKICQNQCAIPIGIVKHDKDRYH